MSNDIILLLWIISIVAINIMCNVSVITPNLKIMSYYYYLLIFCMISHEYT